MSLSIVHSSNAGLGAKEGMYGWSGRCWIRYLGQSIAPLAIDNHLVGAVHLHAETMVVDHLKKDAATGIVVFKTNLSETCEDSVVRMSCLTRTRSSWLWRGPPRVEGRTRELTRLVRIWWWSSKPNS
jgi:hypothetical protein